MKFCRFTLTADPDAGPRLGLMEAGGIRDVTSATALLPPLRWPLPPGDQMIASLDLLRPEMQRVAAGAALLPRAAVRLLSPVANPGKFICGVANWRHQGSPLGALGFLFKVSSALAGADDGVRIRWPDRVTLHEPELAIVIGRHCVNASEQEALRYVAGYTCALDMTMQKELEFFSFCKAFDTFGVLGPCLVTAEEIPDPSALGYTFFVNGEPRGERRFSDLTGSPAQLVAYASSVMTLHPGDVILSGAADVGPVVAGDVMTVDIPDVGRMDVAVTISPDARRMP